MILKLAKLAVAAALITSLSGCIMYVSPDDDFHHHRHHDDKPAHDEKPADEVEKTTT